MQGETTQHPPKKKKKTTACNSKPPGNHRPSLQSVALSFCPKRTGRAAETAEFFRSETPLLGTWVCWSLLMDPLRVKGSQATRTLESRRTKTTRRRRTRVINQSFQRVPCSLEDFKYFFRRSKSMAPLEPLELQPAERPSRQMITLPGDDELELSAGTCVCFCFFVLKCFKYIYLFMWCFLLIVFMACV